MGPFLIVEGPDDYLVLRDHLPGTSFFPADGKANAIRVAKDIVSWDLSRNMTLVVDHDFDGLESIAEIAHEAHPYLGRDLEWMLITLGVLSTVLESQGSFAKLAAAGGPSQVISIIVDACQPVTRLRALNALHGWGLAFDEVDLAKKIDKTSLVLDLAGYCNALLSKSECDLAVDVLISAASAPSEDGLGHRGKDVATWAGASLRKIVGTLPLAATTSEGIAGQLRSSCGLALSQSLWMSELRVRVS
jgi:hypothetical protein